MTALSMLEQTAVSKHKNQILFKQYQKLLACTASFDLEEAVTISRRHNISLDSEDLNRIRNMVEAEKDRSHTGSDHRTVEIKRHAINQIQAYGFMPEKIIKRVDLPKNYCGKILMAAVKGGGFDLFAVLRSGDMWHREILYNTQKELKTLGFHNTDLYALGGAHVRFEAGRRIVVFGTSDDYGACDKKYAAQLIQAAFKGRKLVVTD